MEFSVYKIAEDHMYKRNYCRGNPQFDHFLDYATMCEEPETEEQRKGRWLEARRGQSHESNDELV